MATLTHQQRAERREAIRQAVAAGRDRHEVAARFGVTLNTVYRSSGGFPRLRFPQRRVVDMMVAILRGEAQASIAQRFGVSRQRVNQLRGDMRRVGFFEDDIEPPKKARLAKELP